MSNSFVIVIPESMNIANSLTSVKKGIEDKDGRFTVNGGVGSFSVEGVTGSFTIVGQSVTITIVDKPWIVSEGYIEDHIRTLFSPS